MKNPVWSGHRLDRMTLGGLVVAFFQYPAIWVYLCLSALSAGIAISRPASAADMALAIICAAAIYPLVWYALHRWVLHSQWMFKSRLTASVWKRIHYDHHMDPDRLEVLFGSLATTLPTISAATLPIGWVIGGVGGAAAALASGLLITCIYEFVHCIEHLPYKPRNPLLARMKARHLAHHFHDENGNYGITSFVWDRIFATLYERRQRPAKSPTVFNLGYDEEMARKYPWVAMLSPGLARRARYKVRQPANDGN